MARSQEDGITILLGLKGYEVGKVSEDAEEIMVEVEAKPGGISCPCCSSTKLYRHGLCPERTVLHSFRHQELVHTITEVKKRKVLGILKDDRIATLKRFLSKIPSDKVKEVCIDMKAGLKKAAEGNKAPIVEGGHLDN